MIRSVASRLAAAALILFSGAVAAEDGERSIQGVLAPSISNHDDDGDWYLFAYGLGDDRQCQHKASPSEMQEILNLGPGVVTVPIAQYDGSVVLWPVASARTQQAWNIAQDLRNWRYFPTREACLEEVRWAADAGATCYAGLGDDYDGRAACRAMFKDMDSGECKNIINEERRAACLDMAKNSVSGRRRSGDLGADGWYLLHRDLAEQMRCTETSSPLVMKYHITKETGHELQLIKAEDGSVRFASLLKQEDDGTWTHVNAPDAILFPTMEACQTALRHAGSSSAGLSPP